MVTLKREVREGQGWVRESKVEFIFLGGGGAEPHMPKPMPKARPLHPNVNKKKYFNSAQSTPKILSKNSLKVVERSYARIEGGVE